MSRELMQQALDALKYHTEHTYPFHLTNVAIELLQKELAKPEQEPYFCKDCGKGLLGEGHIHTCSPQIKRQWVGLTDDEVMDAYCETPPFCTYTEAFTAGIRFIETKLKEKNT